MRVRALTVMDLALISQPGFPVVKWQREAKIRVKVRALAVMDLALRRRCVLHRGRSVAEGTPFSAPISLLNIWLQFGSLVLWSDDYYIRSTWYLTINYVTNFRRKLRGRWVGSICVDILTKAIKTRMSKHVFFHGFWACCLGISVLIRGYRTFIV